MLQRRRLMHLPLRFSSDSDELATQPPALGLALHHEAAISGLRAVVRESEKGKRFAATSATSQAAQRRQSPKFDQSRLALVKLQVEFRQSLLESCQHCLRIDPLLESHDEVVAVTDHDDS